MAVVVGMDCGWIADCLCCERMVGYGWCVPFAVGLFQFSLSGVACGFGWWFAGGCLIEFLLNSLWYTACVLFVLTALVSWVFCLLCFCGCCWFMVVVFWL